MYGSAKGLAANRGTVFGLPPTKTRLDDEDAPPLSGINAPGNSLTMDGPATEPVGVNDVQKTKRLKMAMAMAGRGMQGYAQGMQQNAIPNVMPQSSPFDLYGNPIT
jgi:hypothetical protein